jgi:hypothetical protein
MREDTVSESARNGAVSVAPFSKKLMVVLNQHAFVDGIVQPRDLDLAVVEGVFPFNDTKMRKIKSHREHKILICALCGSLG